MLVRTGEKKDLFSKELVKTRQDITDDRGIDMPEVRFGIHIIDGCGHVEILFHG
jgi:hypothetical protein